MEKFEKELPITGKTDEKVFREYMEDLRLTPEDFGKKILDVGAASAQFAKWAKEHGVSKEIYSLEPRREYSMEKEKNVTALAEAIPFGDESFDLVVSRAAIPNIYALGDAIEERVKNSLNEMLRVVKPGGEIRLGRVSSGKVYGLGKIDKFERFERIVSKIFEETLNNLEAEGKIQVEKIIIPSNANNTYQYYDDNGAPVRVLAKTRLIIIRKQKKVTKTL